MSWKPQSKIVTADDLPEFSAQHRLLIVHCRAEWHRIDISMDANLQELKPEFADVIGFYALDCDETRNWAFLNEANVINLPALVAFVNGKHVETLIGLCPSEMLRTKFQEWLSLAQS